MAKRELTEEEREELRAEGEEAFLKWLAFVMRYSYEVYPNDTREALNQLGFNLCAMLDGCQMVPYYYFTIKNGPVKFNGGLHDRFPEVSIEDVQ